MLLFILFIIVLIVLHPDSPLKRLLEDNKRVKTRRTKEKDDFKSKYFEPDDFISVEEFHSKHKGEYKTLCFYDDSGLVFTLEVKEYKGFFDFTVVSVECPYAAEVEDYILEPFMEEGYWCLEKEAVLNFITCNTGETL